MTPAMGNPPVGGSLIPMPKEVSRAESQADQIRVAAERLVAKRVAQGLPPSGSQSEAEAEESLRRLARALIASALDAYETHVSQSRA